VSGRDAAAYRPRADDAFRAELVRGPGNDCLVLSGSVDATNAHLLQAELDHALLAPSAYRLLIDPTEVVHLSAAGVEALAGVLGPAARPGSPVPLVVLATTCPVRRVLDLCAVPYVLLDAA
jgi:anti-anti-sigma regulatory factor